MQLLFTHRSTFSYPKKPSPFHETVPLLNWLGTYSRTWRRQWAEAWRWGSRWGRAARPCPPGPPCPPPPPRPWAATRRRWAGGRSAPAPAVPAQSSRPAPPPAGSPPAPKVQQIKDNMKEIVEEENLPPVATTSVANNWNSVTRFFASGFFSWIFFPQATENNIRNISSEGAPLVSTTPVANNWNNIRLRTQLEGKNLSLCKLYYLKVSKQNN